jgi:hypothetical protein
MSIKYINIFQYKALKNYPNWDFWFENKPSGNPVKEYAAVKKTNLAKRTEKEQFLI